MSESNERYPDASRGMTRAEAAEASARTSGQLAECSNLLRYAADACDKGCASARERGVTYDNLRDAREVRRRVEALVSFIDAGPDYTAWLAALAPEPGDNCAAHPARACHRSFCSCPCPKCPK